MAVHAICAALIFLLAARIEKNHSRTHDYIKILILPESLPTPKVPAKPVSIIPPKPEAQTVRQRVRHQHFSLSSKPRETPMPETPPKVAVAPDATSSMGAISVPVASGNGGDTVNAGTGDSTASGDANEPIPADAVAHPPEIASYVLPEYPRIARARGIEGRVLLRVIIDETGKVEEKIMVVDSIPTLDQAAIDAVHQWRFSPGRDEDGNTVRVLLEVPVRFTLK